MLNAPYNNAYGIWHVTTEGDEEGCSVKSLGVHEGYIDQIAFALADKCMYVLYFSPAKPLDMTPKAKRVHIQLGHDSDMWKMDATRRAAEVSNLLKGRPVSVYESCYSGSVKLETHEDTLADKKRKALAKLTAEEREWFGLN